MTRLTIEVLGGLAIRPESADARFDFPTRKSKAMLAYLALSPGMLRSREHLAAMFWHRSAEEQARASLRQALSGLRRALPGAELPLDANAESVWLDVPAIDIDAVRFESLVVERSTESLAGAVALYRGEFLGGFSLREEPFEQWLSAERRRYHELAMQALSALVGHHERDGHLDRAAAAAERLLALDPLAESAHRSLMRLFLRSGRREAALRQYRECARIPSGRENGCRAARRAARRLKRLASAQRAGPGVAAGTVERPGVPLRGA